MHSQLKCKQISVLQIAVNSQSCYTTLFVNINISFACGVTLSHKYMLFSNCFAEFSINMQSLYMCIFSNGKFVFLTPCQAHIAAFPLSIAVCLSACHFQLRNRQFAGPKIDCGVVVHDDKDEDVKM